ncbi:MAG: hypothetical protein WEB09_03790 [Nitriliruptor sp.]
MLHTVRDLLATIDRLPAPDRAAARARVHLAVQGDARSCRAALGELALDLAAHRLQVRVHHLDDAPVAASA